MSFEKERKINNLLIIAGVLLTAAGAVIHFTFYHISGILLIMAGVSILVIGMSISSAFNRVRMIEMMENRKKGNEK